MKKIIILLLCCGVLISVVGCGGNTAPLPNESSSSIVLETIITETNQIKVGGTDKGVELKQQVEDLKELLNAYYNGTMKMNSPNIESAIIRLTEKFL